MPNAPHFNDPEHWRQRAEESLVLAEQMTDEAARKTMLGIANDYDTLAVRAALCASSIARTLIRNAASEALPYRSSCLLLRTVSLSGRLLCGLRMHLSLGLLEIHRAARLGAFGLSGKFVVTS